MRMMALTVRQPWAWAIVYAGKDVENRNWSTSYRGPLAIHAGLAVDVAGCGILRASGHTPTGLSTGVIIGVATLVDCRRDASSDWAEQGCWHWLLRDAYPLRSPRAHRGRLGLHAVDIRARPS